MSERDAQGVEKVEMWRPHWRADAGGFVAAFAGRWAGEATTDLNSLSDIVRATPNGGQIEIVEVTCA